MGKWIFGFTKLKVDNNQLYDKKVFERALKIILSKSEKPKEEFFSSSMIRYNEATNNLDIISCAQTINELKVYFDSSNKDQNISLELYTVYVAEKIQQPKKWAVLI